MSKLIDDPTESPIPKKEPNMVEATSFSFESTVLNKLKINNFMIYMLK
jgi:hypothetical protein